MSAKSTPDVADSVSVASPQREVARSVSRQAAWSHHSLLTLFVVFWGSNFILAEVALREMAPLSFSVARFFVGGVALIAVLYAQCTVDARRHGQAFQLFPQVDRKDWGRLFLVAVLGALLAPWLGIEGLGLTHGARASLWLALGPALSSAIGYLLKTERIGRIGFLGVMLAGLGTFALAADGLLVGSAYWLGDVLLFVALACAVAELHLIKPLAKKYGATPMVTSRTVIGGALYLLVAAPSLAGESWAMLGFWTWVAILAGGAIGVGIGQWVKVRALDILGPTRVVLYGNLVPLAALGVAWLALGTVPSVLEVLAGAFIIAGSILLQRFDPVHRAEKGVLAPPTE